MFLGIPLKILQRAVSAHLGKLGEMMQKGSEVFVLTKPGIKGRLSHKSLLIKHLFYGQQIK